MSESLQQSGFCRDCLADAPAGANRCAACSGRRIIAHPELFDLAIAHLDCDAFYAAIEKRDNPELADKPVIVGGGKRGVVATACYVARTYGIRSAMPMYRALKACPDAVVIRPDIAKYAAVGREARRLMQTLTPLVEPLSIDEAFMDLSGTVRIHGAPPAVMLAKLQKRFEAELGVTASVGLSHNKFLAKIASDLDKPRGFSVIGRAETISFLAAQPISLIWGVGAATAARLEQDGLKTIGQLQAMEESVLARRYGEIGLRLARLSRGIDARTVTPERETKSVSAEITFDEDVSDARWLEDRLWALCEKVSTRMKEKSFAGRVVTLKLKTADFRTLTRRRTLEHASNLARTAYAAACAMLAETTQGRAFRLIGVGYSGLEPAGDAQQSELFKNEEARIAAQERVIDRIRSKYGAEAIGAARALRRADKPSSKQ